MFKLRLNARRSKRFGSVFMGYINRSTSWCILWSVSLLISISSTEWTLNLYRKFKFKISHIQILGFWLQHVSDALLFYRVPTMAHDSCIFWLCFFFQMTPHVFLVDFVVLPPEHGRNVTEFWGWDAHEAQLRCPDGVSGDIGGYSSRKGLKPKFY